MYTVNFVYIYVCGVSEHKFYGAQIEIRVAVCCSVLQCAAVRHSALQ